MFEPPNPVPKYYYRCDKTFHLDDLLKLYVVHDTYAIVLISGKRTDIYAYSKNNVKLIKTIECSLPNQHKTGGSSAPRFGRIRDEKINLYVKNIAELMFMKLIKNNVFQHLGLFLAGPGDLKGDVQGNGLFQQHFQKYLLRVITTPEITDKSINYVSDIIGEIVYGVTANTKIMDRIDELILDVNKIDLLVFGETFVLEQLKLGTLKEVFVYGKAIELVNDYLDCKTNVTIIENDAFVKKYGSMVGLRYYGDVLDDVDDILNGDE